MELRDIVWVVVSAALVFLMQPGFLCLETGLTRSKNSINVAIKNLTDFGISVFTFWAVGFGVMFGVSYAGLIGTSNFFVPFTDGQSSLAAFFLFQAMFCGTATTIVSGAVAERMRFAGYLVLSVVLSTFIYTLFGHWTWGGVYSSTPGWLQERGFRDFAGSSVVHSVGGWVALAAVVVIGPREGRFNVDGSRRFTGQNVPVATLGVLLMWVGWFGFNGGSTLALDHTVPRILANTVLSGAAGLIGALLIGWPLRGRPDIDLVMNGSLAGLAAITASCHAVSPPAAVMIGCGGAVAYLTGTWLLERWHIDDVVGAIPVHAGAGAWGTVALAVFGDAEKIGSGLSRLSQVGVQLLGMAVCLAWSFGAAYVILQLLNRLIPLRVTPEEERRGLNVVEHGATTELTDLLTVMEGQSRTGDLSRRVPVEPFSEVGQIADLYNRVLESLEEADQEIKRYADELERSNRDLNEFASMASHDLQAPLRRVKGLCDLLFEKNEELDKDKRPLVDYIQCEISDMETLIHDLLNYARIDSKGNPLEEVDSSQVVKRAIALLDGPIHASRAQVTYADLPTVHADPRQLAQVFQNLIGNAIKYCEQAPRVHVSAERQNDAYLFKVCDNGIGIPAEHRDRVFQMLTRLHHSGKYSGTGIGLAICKRIVDRHKGRIWVEPGRPNGSVFCFTLSNSA